MIYLITRFYRVRAKNEVEARKWLNEAIRNGCEHVYFKGEALRQDNRQKAAWLPALAQEFIRQLMFLLRGTKRRW